MTTTFATSRVSQAKQDLTGILQYFMPISERNALTDGLRGEEREGIAEIIEKAADTIRTMPPYLPTGRSGA
ncbi:MAG: hypothetical protein WC291_00495 [Thermodesulfovibrionales bacterium]